MSNARTYLQTHSKQVGLAAIAATLLIGGATWRGVAADHETAAQSTVVTTRAESPALRRESYADIVKIAAPAVVTIRVEGRAEMAPTGMPDDDLFRRFFGRERGNETPSRGFRQRGLGSGVIVSADGYLLTNHHVVQRADNIEVELSDGRTFKAKMVGSDQPSDLAVLKIDATNVKPLALGDSEAVQVGDVVLAVGNPLGIGQTVTMGIISAKGRSTGPGDGSYEDFLQTDAPINQGNSGGALVNLKGELVGINSQIMSTSEGNIGIGFAIPANMARHVMTELKAGGHVRRAQLGVTVQGLTSDMAENLGLKDVGGAIVNSVSAGSAAGRAGVKPGDVITSFNGQPVHDTNSLRNRVAETAPGSTATLVVLRDGREQTLTVTLDEAFSTRSARGRNDDAETSDKTALGVAVTPVTPDLAERAGAPKDTQGLMVQDVDPQGRAAAAGIRRGDIIEQVNRRFVRNVEDLRAALKSAAEKPALVLVSREGKDFFVTVKPS